MVGKWLGVYRCGGKRYISRKFCYSDPGLRELAFPTAHAKLTSTNSEENPDIVNGMIGTDDYPYKT